MKEILNEKQLFPMNTAKMAGKTLLDSSRLFNQIQQNESKDGNVHIFTKLDVTDFDNDSQFRMAPITLLERQQSFKFQICVMRSDVDNISLGLKMSPANKDIDLEWPITVKWKVSVINENTEQSFDFNPIYTIYNRQSLENQENKVSDTLLINLNNIRNFIFNNNLLFKWSIECVPSQQETLSTIESSGVTQDIYKLKAHIESIIDFVQQNGNKLKNSDCRRQMEEIKTKFSKCELDEDKLVTMENKLSEADERIDKLLEQFQTQADQVSTFMSEFNGALAHGVVTVGTDIGTLDPRTDNKIYHPDTSAESEDSSRCLHFLLVGESKAGKSATGNSILLKNVFKSGLHRNVPYKPSVNKSHVRLSNLNACITVVESHNKILDDSFNICPKGFDAILYVVSYNRLYEDSYTMYYEKPFTDEKPKEMKHNFGIVLITGGDSIELDYPNQDIHTIFGGWNDAFCRLEDAVQGRVILFDNTTTSEKKKIEQLTKLLEIVDNLPNRPTRFNREWHIKYTMSSFKSSISNLHILKHGEELNQILNRFMENNVIDFQLENVCRLIQNTAERVKFSSFYSHRAWPHRYNRYDMEESVFLDEISVLIFGKQSESIKAFDTQTECMGIRAHYRPIQIQLYSRVASGYTGIILVIPFSKVSQEEQEMIRNYISVDAFRAKSILVVTDVDSENVKERESEFFERCKDETDVFKELYEFCSGRVVLFDCKTEDAIKRLQQEANLVKILLDLKFAPQKETTSSISSSPFVKQRLKRGFSIPNSVYLTEKKREDIHLNEFTKLEIDACVEEKPVIHKTFSY